MGLLPEKLEKIGLKTNVEKRQLQSEDNRQMRRSLSSEFKTELALIQQWFLMSTFVLLTSVEFPFMCIVLGLDYVTEYQMEDPNTEACYICDLCQSKMDPRQVISHVIGLRHRNKYFVSNFSSTLPISCFDSCRLLLSVFCVNFVTPLNEWVPVKTGVLAPDTWSVHCIVRIRETQIVNRSNMHSHGHYTPAKVFKGIWLDYLKVW
jgi:hypothetical protein